MDNNYLLIIAVVLIAICVYACWYAPTASHAIADANGETAAETTSEGFTLFGKKASKPAYGK